MDDSPAMANPYENPHAHADLQKQLQTRLHGGSGGTGTATISTGEVRALPQNLDAIDAALNELHEEINRLTDQLAPVRRPAADAPLAPEEAAIGDSHVSHRLHSIRLMVDAARSRIRDCRLEIEV